MNIASCPMLAGDNSLLLVLPLPIYNVGGILYLEKQACNGLRLWLQNFDRVTLCAPRIDADNPPTDSRPILEVAPGDRVAVEMLPLAWNPLVFAHTLPATSRRLGALIDQSRFLHFAIGGLWGDWAAVAAMVASRRGRKAAIWTDRVESQVMRFQALDYRGARRLFRRFNAFLARHWERFVIRRATMGLFHGMDTYRAYAGFSADPHLVHNIHVGPEARITAEDLARKLARADAVPLRIVYGGRVHPDKGVADWIEALSLLRAQGTSFAATWYGDGPLLDEARYMVAARGLGDLVRFPGPTQNHAELMAAFRDADIFLFCHQTPESPRCLIEALLSGTPIVGYESHYSRDLIAPHGGGLLTPIGRVALLAEMLAGLGQDRPRLRALSQNAARDGFPMVDEDVFRHRSELMKSRLGG